MSGVWKCDLCDASNYGVAPVCSCGAAKGTRRSNVPLRRSKKIKLEPFVGNNRSNTLVKALIGEDTDEDQSWRDLSRNIAGSDAPKKLKLEQVLSQPDLIRASAGCLRLEMYSSSTLSTYASEIATYERICGRAGEAPWPATVNSISFMAGALRTAGYQSIRMYVVAVCTCNSILGFSMDSACLAGVKAIKRAIERGKQDVHRVNPITSDQIRNMLETESLSPYLRLAANLMCIGFAFLLRGEELLSLQGLCFCSEPCDCSSHIRICNNVLSLKLVECKTSISNHRVVRTLECVCVVPKSDGTVMCPVCAVRYLVASTTGDVSSPDWFLSSGRKKSALGYKGFVDAIFKLLELINVTTVKDGQRLFGSQSLRRGGAQQLALQLWSISCISSWGRWSSSAVLIYIQDAPLRARQKSISYDLCNATDPVDMGAKTGTVSMTRGTQKLTKGANILVARNCTEFEGETVWFAFTVSATPRSKKKVRVSKSTPNSQGKIVVSHQVLDLESSQWFFA